MKIEIQTCKGNYTTESLADARRWYEEHQPAFASVIMPTGTGPWPHGAGVLEVEIRETWTAAIEEVVRELFEGHYFDADPDMPNVAAAPQLATMLEATQEQCVDDPETIDVLVRWAGHDWTRSKAE